MQARAYDTKPIPDDLCAQNATSSQKSFLSWEAFRHDLLEMLRKLSSTCRDHLVRHIWILAVLLLIIACQGMACSCTVPW